MEKTPLQIREAVQGKASTPANGGMNCASCRHLEPPPEGQPNSTCHRFPPQVVGTIIVNPTTGQMVAPHMFFFPEVGDPEQVWCGEYAARLNG